MATSPNQAIRPQTARRVSVKLTAAANGASGNVATVGASLLCNVGPNSLSWLVKMSSAPLANVAAYNILLFWSPDNVNLNYVTKYAVPAFANTGPGAETDFGLTETAFRLLAPAAAGANSFFYVASDTALTAGIMVNAEVEDA